MSGGRWSASATLLGLSSNGTTSQKVLIAGGINGTASVNTARLYNQTAGTWAAAGTLNTARHLHTATLLADGRVLVCGGMNGSTVLTSAALYNPASGSGSWAATTGPIPPPGWRSGTATLIHTSNNQLNHKVLLAGGNNGTSTISAVFLFDPAQSAFSTLASMPSPREGHQAVALSDGRILFAGGKNGSSYLASSVIFDPSWGPGNWTGAGNMISPRWGHAMDLLPSGVLHLGIVLVSGGSNGTSTLSSTEYWNGTNWATDGAMVAPVQRHASVPLGNSILIAGGAINNGSTTVSAAEIYDPSIGLGCTSNSQCASGFCVSGVCCDSACNGGCGSCNLAGHLGTCTPLTSGTVCRAMTEICDVAETCDGSSLACPGDAYQPPTTVCRASAGTCDLAETCTGGSAACPTDVFQSPAIVCRPTVGVCDVADSCTGASAACPPDEYQPNGASCNDTNACTTADVCSGGACIGGPPPSCDDGNVCTTDTCNPTTGCEHANNTESCSDGDSCTADDACSEGACIGGPPPSCDDGNVCTDDSCDPATGCVYANNTAPCNDDDACTQSDICQQGECVGSDPVACLVIDPCHTRACHPGTGLCVATELPDETPCDDHNACTRSDTCQAGVCTGIAGSQDCDPDTSSCVPPTVVCAQPSDPCFRSVCEPHSGSCITVPTEGKICDDGDPDTQDDICVAGICGGHHQSDGFCGTMPSFDGSLRDDSNYVAAVQAGEIESTSYAFIASADPVANVNSTFVTIPVVFHVLDLNGTPTVTDDEIRAELARINQEFRNAFYTDLTGYSHSVAGNPRIQFALAQRTPACAQTNGIERRNTTTTDFDVCTTNTIRFTAQGGLDAWTNANNPSNNPVNYLNIWISPIDRDPEGPNPRLCTAVTSGVVFGGLGNGTLDGIKAYPRAFRLKSTANPQPYRAISHEIGHWLGLYHTFESGTTTCEGANESPNTGDCATRGDLICDTPACTLQRTCPDDTPDPRDLAYVANTCTDTPTNNVDMFANLMGYYGTRSIYHTCRNMFTADQSLRMQGVLLGSVTSRSSSTPFDSGMQSLLWSAGLIPPVSGPDIWMADSQADVGDEPNNASTLLYDSDDIWNREACDGLLEHQNPKYGSENCLYIRIRNRGCSDYTGSNSKQLTLYWAKASTALSWPDPWTGKVKIKGTNVKMGDVLGSVTLTTGIAAGQTIVANAKWSPPNPADYASFGGDKNHFCLLARISGDGSPAKGETTDLAGNVKKNKTIVWKNVEVTSDSAERSAYVTVGPAPSGAMKLIFTELTGNNDVSIFDLWGTVNVDMGAGLYAKWVAGGKQGTNVTEVSPGIVVLGAPNASLENLALAADEYFTLRLGFTPYPDNPQAQRRNPDVYRFDVSESSATGALIGGQRVTLKTYAAAGHSHHAPPPPIP